MSMLLHELPRAGAARKGSAPALAFKGNRLDYGALLHAQDRFAASLTALGLECHERVAIFLPKQFVEFPGFSGHLICDLDVPLQTRPD